MSVDSEISQFESELEELEAIKNKVVLKKKPQQVQTVTEPGIVVGKFDGKINETKAMLDELKMAAPQKPTESIFNKTLNFNKKFSELLTLNKMKKDATLAPTHMITEHDIMLDDLMDQLFTEDMPDVAPKEKPSGSIFGQIKHLAGEIGLIEADYSTPEKKVKIKPTGLEIRVFNEFDKPLDTGKAIFYFDGKKTSPTSASSNSAFFDSVSVEEIVIRMLGYVDVTTSLSFEGEAVIARMHTSLKLTITDGDQKPLDNVFITITDEDGERLEDISGNFVWRTPFPADAESGNAYISINQAGLFGTGVLIWVVKAGFSESKIVAPVEMFSTSSQLEQAVALSKINSNPGVKGNVTTR